MNLKVCLSPVLTLTLLLSISGCTNRNTAADTTVLPDLTTKTLQQTTAEALQQPSSIMAETAANTQTTESNSSISTEPLDLLDRIRQGFTFPALESTHISQYEKWSTEHDSYLNGLFARGTPFLYHIVEE
ncbi:MAG: putative lipoprotein NlpE involved in copper resistance, partial [Arenicella sp.]